MRNVRCHISRTANYRFCLYLSNGCTVDHDYPVFLFRAREEVGGGMFYSYLSNVRGGIDSDFPLLQRLPHMEHSILQTNHDRKY